MTSKLGRIADAARAFLSGTSGGTTVMVSLAGVAMLGTGGAAVDYVHSRLILTGLQADLDGAVLAGAGGTLNEKKQVATAQAYFAEATKSRKLPYQARFWVKRDVVYGSAVTAVETSLLKVLDIRTINLSAKSAASARATMEPLCLMAMHPTRQHTLEMKGSVSIVAPECNIYGNSNHEFDVVDPHTPQNFMKAKFVAAIGGGHHYLQNVTPPVEFGTKLIEDPLQRLSVPAPGACTKTKYSISNQHITLPPGHYCGGLSISRGSAVELEEGGTYFISGGSFNINQSELTGKNVTVFLADSRANIQWSDGRITLSAKKTGDFAGLAVFGVREETDNSFSESEIDIHGALYMPEGAFTWENDGDFTPTAKWSAFVVDGFSWTGKGTIRLNFDLAASDIPYPEDLIAMPRPTDVRLVD